MDRNEDSNTPTQSRLDPNTQSANTRTPARSSPQSRVRDLASEGSTEGQVPRYLHPIHALPVSQPAHPNLQSNTMNVPRQSLMSIPTLNDSPSDEHGSTIGLLPQRQENRRRYSPPIHDTQLSSTTPPRAIEPIMLRPPSMRNTRPISESHFVEDERQRNEEHRSRQDSWNEQNSMKAECTVRERLQPTLDHSKAELVTYKARAKISGWSVNAAIGAQVLFGALTTGVSAATTGKRASIATSILGALSTMAASYLAKARGSGEPEASSARARELEQFGRDCEAFILDHGNSTSSVFDDRIARFRRRFEEIMGNDPSDGIGDFPDPVKGYADRRKHNLPV